MAFKNGELAQRGHDSSSERYSSNIIPSVEPAGSGFLVYRNSDNDDVTVPRYFNSAARRIFSADFIWVVEGGANPTGGTLYQARVFGNDVSISPYNAGIASSGGIKRSTEWTWFTAISDGLYLYSWSGASGGAVGEVSLGLPVGGGFQINTGSTSNSSSRITTAPSFMLGFGNVRFRTDVSIEALSTLSEEFSIAVGLQAGTFQSHTNNDEILFRYTDSVNGGNWVCVSQSGGGGEETTNTAVAPTLGTNRQVLEIVVNADGTQVFFYIDGVLVATHTSVPSVVLRHGMGINKLEGTSSRSLYPLGSGWDYNFTAPI